VAAGPLEESIGMAGLLVPGYGATPRLYAPGLPPGWEVLAPPSFRASGGELAALARWLADELRLRPGRSELAGHSLGGALAVLAALAEPARVERLLLLAPAGLPFAKPLAASGLTFMGQVARGCYPPRELAGIVAGVAAAPLAARRLARSVHRLDLRAELAALRTAGVRCTVVGCTRDELATPAHCRRLAELAGAGYRELDSDAAHIWPILEPALLRVELGLQPAEGAGAPA